MAPTSRSRFDIGFGAGFEWTRYASCADGDVVPSESLKITRLSHRSMVGGCQPPPEPPPLRARCLLELAKTDWHSALECLNIDFTGFEKGFVEDCNLHIGGDGGGGGGATHHTGERGSRVQDHGESRWDAHPECLPVSRSERTVQTKAAPHGHRHRQPVPRRPRQIRSCCPSGCRRTRVLLTGREAGSPVRSQ